MLPHNSQLSAELQRAYRAALYRVYLEDGEAQTLRAGQRSDWLAQHLQQRAASGACYLTACNPWGQVLSDAENTERMNALRQQLQQQGLNYNEGCGEDPKGQWPGESSVLIWNMDAATALQWGLQWEQNAVLWSAADGVPQLLWLR